MRRWFTILAGTLWLAGCASTTAPLPPGVQWTPSAWVGEDTVTLRTDCPDEGEYWFPVWLVVFDDQLYVRLGSKAAARIGCARGAPTVPVRIAGKQFDHIKMTSVPELASRVHAAMAAKYSTDIFVRYVTHPLTLRLAPE